MCRSRLGSIGVVFRMKSLPWMRTAVEEPVGVQPPRIFQICKRHSTGDMELGKTLIYGKYNVIRI